MKKIIVWTIAGSDSSGASGIQADLKTFQTLGVQGCNIITAVTAQNSFELNTIKYLPSELITDTIKTLATDLPPTAIKIGMLGKTESIKVIISYLKNYLGYVVLDPVLISSSGKKLFTDESYLSFLKEIFQYVDVLTPNIAEAEKIVGFKIKEHQDIKNAAHAILKMGAKNVVIKGGHYNNPHYSQDYWTNGKKDFWLTGKRYLEKNCRGTGCTFSSAITACLALGYEIKDALVIAKMYISQSIRLANDDFLNHTKWPDSQDDLPFLTRTPDGNFLRSFPPCNEKPLGLYPVVESFSWIKRLLSQGVKTLQLRIKDKNGEALENEIYQSIQLAKQYHAKLFINDYWDLAIRYNAYGVHLGQEDLAEANINQIFQSGLRLGISTHSYSEVAHAHSFQPSYIAFGPIYPTTSKIMPFLPQGIEKLNDWCKTLRYPVVAIGGITLANIDTILTAQPSGIALISAITHSTHPKKITQQLLHRIKQFQ